MKITPPYEFFSESTTMAAFEIPTTSNLELTLSDGCKIDFPGLETLDGVFLAGTAQTNFQSILDISDKNVKTIETPIECVGGGDKAWLAVEFKLFNLTDKKTPILAN